MNHQLPASRPCGLDLASIASWAALAVAASLPQPALANLGDTYGFGSRSAAMAGAGTAWGFDAYSAALNPAALSIRPYSPSETSGAPDHHVRVSWGVIGMQPKFLPIRDVVIENNFTSDKTPPRTGDVDTSYRPTLGQALGLDVSLLPRADNLSLGISTFVPLQHVSYLDTGENFIPEYVLDRARTQRPQVEAGLGIELAPGWHLGVGMHIGFGVTSDATVFLQGSADKASTARIAASLEPKASPVASLLYRTNLDGSEPGPSPKLTAGVVVRGPLSSGIEMNLASGARIMGSVAAVDLLFNADSTLYYDPLSVETGVSLEYLPGARVIAQLDTQLWSKFEAPALIIADPQSTCTNTDESSCGLQVSGGLAPDFHATDIVIVRLAHEWQATDHLTLRLGYAHRPSIFDSLPEGAGNYLDPSREIFTGGLGYQLSSFFGAQIPCQLDFHLAYHSLETQHITKDSGDELGAGTGDLKIGAPGYDAGGNILGGGLSLSFAL